MFVNHLIHFPFVCPIELLSIWAAGQIAFNPLQMWAIFHNEKSGWAILEPGAIFVSKVSKRFCLQSITGKRAASSPKIRISPAIAALHVSKKGGKTMSCKGNKTAACGGMSKLYLNWSQFDICFEWKLQCALMERSVLILSNRTVHELVLSLRFQNLTKGTLLRVFHC